MNRETYDTEEPVKLHGFYADVQRSPVFGVGCQFFIDASGITLDVQVGHANLFISVIWRRRR